MAQNNSLDSNVRYIILSSVKTDFKLRDAITGYYSGTDISRYGNQVRNRLIDMSEYLIKELSREPKPDPTKVIFTFAGISGLSLAFDLYGLFSLSVLGLFLYSSKQGLRIKKFNAAKNIRGGMITDANSVYRVLDQYKTEVEPLVVDTSR